jgi:serine/threonine protein kinase
MYIFHLSWREEVMKGEYVKDNNVQLRSPMALDLISRILTVDPSKRLTGPEILSHPWFQNLFILYLSYIYHNLS